jgi:TRAP-type C4-dicarboxylate transport system permease small subunit
VKFIQRFDLVLEKISRYGLIAAFFSMLVLSVLAIVFRWMGESLLWVDPLVRHLVFASAFLGGSLATSKNVHISVDVLTKLLEKSKSKILHWLHKNLVRLFCLLTCLGLARAGYQFYLSEKEFGAPAFLGIHSSFLVGIICVGMLLISLRYLNQILISILSGEASESHHL